MLPKALTSCRQVWQVHKIITEDVNRPGELRNSAPIIFYDSISAVLYAANREFSSNACRKLMTRTIKNRHDGIRVKIVLNLTNRKWLELILTAALTSRSEINCFNYDARIRL